MKYVYSLAVLALFFVAAAGQDRPRKPVLIRVPDADENAETVVIPDPNQAAESVKIGDFYFKRKNYKAAEKRYREAIIHLPKWPEPYTKLAKSLGKRGAFQEAVDACDLFVATNPDHKRVPHFEKLAEKFKSELRKKSG